MKLLKIAKEQALIPCIKLGCFSNVYLKAVVGSPWGEKRKIIHSNTSTIIRYKNALHDKNNCTANHLATC